MSEYKMMYYTSWVAQHCYPSDQSIFAAAKKWVRKNGIWSEENTGEY